MADPPLTHVRSLLGRRLARWYRITSGGDFFGNSVREAIMDHFAHGSTVRTPTHAGPLSRRELLPCVCPRPDTAAEIQSTCYTGMILGVIEGHRTRGMHADHFRSFSCP